VSERSIFLAALERTDPHERAAYLDQACGSDRELRQRVEQLLRAHVPDDSFLEKPPPHLTATTDHVTEGAGTHIGPFRLLEQIGEGGMGLVFVAEQQQPVRRRVALKIIKPGMDSAPVIARFEAERQALALMDHQNIARVFDAGTTDSGRPYFVMELVHGVPITEYCDANQLTPRQRLELFMPICQAIQHAHQKGIIHRDLKPSNVLVTMYDDRPVPKVIDFGVAKAIDQRLTEKTVYTQFGTLVGTLEYMSPEQAEMNAFGVDTRSDIYALGVLLYELLTGTTPLERARLREAAFAEIVRRIKEEEPPRPSVRLSTSGAQALLARARRTDPATLSRLVRGELDWIVMRCLEKDRTRRYDSASGLARDVEHYLRDEPVEARPPSAWYRFCKLARRNKVALTTTMLVAVALVLGTAVSTWQAIRAEIAREEAEMARSDEAKQRLAANQARQEAEDRAEELRRIANELRVEKDKLERTLANARVSQAHAAWRDNNLVVAHELLDACPPEQRFWDWRYVKSLCSGGRFTMYGHPGPVTSVAYSPDGQVLASGSGSRNNLNRAGEVRVWDAHTGREVWVLKGHTGSVNSVAFSPDGQVLASGSDDGTVRLWNPTTGKEGWVLEGHTGSVHRLVFSPDGNRLASEGGWNRTVRVWDVRSGEQLWVFEGEKEGGTGLAFRPDGQCLALASGTMVRLCDSATGKQVRVFEGHTDKVGSVAFSPDGQYLASTGSDRTVRVWDAASGQQLWLREDPASPVSGMAFSPAGQCLAFAVGKAVQVCDNVTGRERVTLREQAASVLGLAFSPDGRHLAVRTDDRTVRVWEVHGGKEQWVLQGHTDRVSSLAFSPDGRSLVSGSTDRTVRLWDLRGGPHLLTLRGHTGRVTSVAFSPDGRRLASGSEDKTVRVCDSDTGRQRLILRGHTERVNCVAFSPDGRRLASASDKDHRTWGGPGEIRLWDTRTGEELLTLPSEVGVLDLAFSPDGQRLASGGHGGRVQLWDAHTGRELLSILGHIDRVTSVAFHPDGQRLASMGWDGTMRIWNVDTGEPQWGFKSSQASPQRRSVTFSPDGERIALADGGTVWILNSGDGQLLLTLKGHTGGIRSVAFSADGQRLASCGEDGTVRLWDARSGQELLSLAGHTGRVTGVAFSPDHQCLASCGEDGTVRLWGSHPGPRVFSLSGHVGYVTSVAFGPNGHRLASGGNDQRIRLWDVRTGQDLQVFEGHDASVLSLAFSPDGRWLASGSGEVDMPENWRPFGQLKVWDIASGRELRSFKAPHGDRVSSVAFSPDGKRLASGGDDRMVRLWEVDTGKELLALKGHTDWVINLAFSPDGRTLWSEDRKGNVKAWDLESGEEEAVRERPRFAGGPGFSYSPDGRHFALARGDVLVVETPSSEEYTYRRRISAPDPSWHQFEAGDAERARQWFAVVFHLDWLARNGRADPDLYQRCGRAQAEREQWAQASQDFARVVREAPDRVAAWHNLALAYLGAGDVDAYRRTCADLLTQVRQTSDPSLATALLSSAPGDFLGAIALVDVTQQAAWQRLRERRLALRAWTLRADEGADPAGVLSLASPWDPVTRGAVLHRLGQDAEAAELLRVSTGLTGLLYLALAEHARGRREEAREALGQAVRQVEAASTEGRRVPWEERFEDGLLRREAEALVQPREP
jgi:WD40 repeat protein/serine/threonine protein kinase/tetratricopeptide (TPR) repeat protein